MFVFIFMSLSRSRFKRLAHGTWRYLYKWIASPLLLNSDVAWIIMLSNAHRIFYHRQSSSLSQITWAIIKYFPSFQAWQIASSLAAVFNTNSRSLRASEIFSANQHKTLSIYTRNRRRQHKINKKRFLKSSYQSKRTNNLKPSSHSDWALLDISEHFSRTPQKHAPKKFSTPKKILKKHEAERWKKFHLNSSRQNYFWSLEALCIYTF